MIQSITDLSAVKTTTEQILKLSSIFFLFVHSIEFRLFFTAFRGIGNCAELSSILMNLHDDITDVYVRTCVNCVCMIGMWTIRCALKAHAPCLFVCESVLDDLIRTFSSTCCLYSSHSLALRSRISYFIFVSNVNLIEEKFFSTCFR